MAERKPRTSAAFCEACGERIIFATTEHGETQAVDYATSPLGSLWVYQAPSGWRARDMRSGPERRHPLEKPHLPHAATCRGPAQQTLSTPNGGSSDE